jgi:hypothetical protein
MLMECYIYVLGAVHVGSATVVLFVLLSYLVQIRFSIFSFIPLSFLSACE